MGLDLTSLVGIAYMTVIVIFLLILGGFCLWWLMDFFRYNIEVVIKRQVGKPYIEERTGKLVIPIESFTTRAKIYMKKIGQAYKEYIHIKGTDYNYQNVFPDEYFYTRVKAGMMDIKKKGILLLYSQDKGLIPLAVHNPGIEVGTVTLNDTITGIADSLKEINQLYHKDFWEKYGAIITLSMIAGIFVVGMLFVIKYQEVFWKNSIGQLETVLATLKSTAAPQLPAQP